MGTWKVKKQGPDQETLYKPCALVVVWIFTKDSLDLSALEGSFAS